MRSDSCWYNRISHCYTSATFSQADEELAFTATVSWVKHNEDERFHLFAELFSFVDLKQLSKYFLNRTVKVEVSATLLLSAGLALTS